MTFLPVAERELRVASRRPNTFWTRIGAALTALVIGSLFFSIYTYTPSGFGGTGLGRALFETLTWLCLGVALCAGLFFTSDSLSEEKREGTIGLLFLTDLAGYDVVLGKLLATSLRGFYGVLAVFPIVAVTLLMGGVTGAQFWKAMLALVNAMFVSLAAGLFISSKSQDPQRAMMGTLALLAGLIALGPLADAWISDAKGRGFTPFFSFSSPGYLFAQAGGANVYWSALAVNQLIAWVLLAAACVLLPRSWQQTGRTRATPRQLSREVDSRRRSRLLDVNPVLWLTRRERWQSVTLWCASGGIVALGAAQALAANQVVRYTLSSFGSLLFVGLYLAVTTQACRFFVDARRSGLLEIILGTEITAQQVVRGQVLSLARMLRFPLALCLCMQLVSVAIVQYSTMSQMRMATTSRLVASTNSVPSTQSVPVPAPPAWSQNGQAIAAATAAMASTLLTLANVLALCWFGMRMGLGSKSTNIATLKTLAFVQVIPWFVITIITTFSIFFVSMTQALSGLRAGALMQWYPVLTSLVAALLGIGKDVVFIIWARKTLLQKVEARDW